MCNVCTGMKAVHYARRHCTPESHRRVYRPSALERAWTNRPAVERICAISRSKEQEDGARIWLNYSKSGWQRSCEWNVTLREADSKDRSVLSQFVYDDGYVEFIEPLTGIARHPFAPVGCRQGDLASRKSQPAFFRLLFDISYLIPSTACGASIGPRVSCYLKSRFYDLGSTEYISYSMHDLKARASGRQGGGPSVPLFTELYRRRCLPFNDVYAWEANQNPKFAPAMWYSNVPKELRSTFHYFNVPVHAVSPNTTSRTQHATMPAAAGDPAWRRLAQAGDFLGTLLSTASPDDFVVVKLDIEGQTGSPEHAIAEAIANSPKLSRLVDEIYFEFHFWFDGLNFAWGDMPRQGNPDVDVALNLMKRLRGAGVRAHFWI